MKGSEKDRFTDAGRRLPANLEQHVSMAAFTHIQAAVVDAK